LAGKTSPPQGLILRVDNRLLHGQVLLGWGEGWPADEIWLVSDRIVSDSLECELYTDAIPGNIDGGVLSLNEAAEKWRSLPEVDTNILVVLESISDLLLLLEKGMMPIEAGLGNQEVHKGKHVYLKELRLDNDDLEVLEKVCSIGIPLVIRPLPHSVAIEVKV